MKLLYTVTLWFLIKLFLIKPIQASTLVHTTSLKDKLLDFYGKGLNSISESFLKKANDLCKELLKDEKVQRASTPIFKELKKNLTDFLHDYPKFKHYGLVNPLAIIFDEKLQIPLSHSKDFQYIWELIRKNGYDALNMDYESEYKRFIEQKFIPKFKELKAQLSPQELGQQDDLFNWFRQLERCTDNLCLHDLFTTFVLLDRTPKNELQEYVDNKLAKLNMFYCYAAYDILKNVLKDSRFTQISSPLMQYLTIDINEFTMNFESNEDIDDLQTEIETFNENILQKYYYNTDIPNKDHKLIVDIFNAHGYAKLFLKYQLKFNNFIDNELSNKILEYKTKIIEETLAKEQKMLKSFEDLKSLNDSSMRYEKFMKFYNLL
ncbi:uncharacterized protein LOC124419674 [Lucilia cuprina]|uniref:uncharacterized protein LOC124419674 n=1 Tax=Lucilia cuprina TaxID=7375 RepID=UPI001F056140|nr:uncharacterized protein LOC124419674 [Lucilia cuprina]